MFKKIVYIAMIGLVLLSSNKGTGINALADSSNANIEIELQLALLEEESKVPAVKNVLDSFNSDEKLILDVCTKELSITNKNQLAYILATARHESAQFRTLTEYASGASYEGRADLGNTQQGDGVRFKGRGYVQLTGRTNYTLWSKWLNQDLVGNPDSLINDRHQSAWILCSGMKFGSFTGAKNGNLADYINESKTDYHNARKLVNSLDEAQRIADYAKDYENRLANYKPTVPVVRTQNDIDLENAVELEQAIETANQNDLDLEIAIAKASDPFDPSNAIIIDTSKPEIKADLSNLTQQIKSDTIGKKDIGASGVDTAFDGQCVTYVRYVMQNYMHIQDTRVGDAKDYINANADFLNKYFDRLEVNENLQLKPLDIFVMSGERMAQIHGHTGFVETSGDGNQFTALASNGNPSKPLTVESDEHSYSWNNNKRQWASDGRSLNKSDIAIIYRLKAEYATKLINK